MVLIFYIGSAVLPPNIVQDYLPQVSMPHKDGVTPLANRQLIINLNSYKMQWLRNA